MDSMARRSFLLRAGGTGLGLAFSGSLASVVAPDNITVSPHGYAVMCTDGEDANQFLAGITPRGQTFPLAHNRMSDEEFAGATFSPDGGTLFVNVQVPGTTFAIWGPWR
jgi:secreted PhoX family phosphatase